MNLVAVAPRLGLALVFVLIAPFPGRAQVFHHPRDMGFGDSRFGIGNTAMFRFQLENGLPGFVVPDLTVPLIQLTAFVRAGRGDDDHQGVAEMLVAAMRRGPCWMGASGFRQAMNRMAATLEIHMTADLTEISFNVPAEHAEQGMRVFSGIIREPCLDREGLEAFRRPGGEGGGTPAFPPPGTGNEPGPLVRDGSLQLAVDLFHAKLFEGHRYDDVITEQDLTDLALDDVEDFHREFFTPTNMVLAVSGAFERRRILQQVDQRFADWEERRPPRLRNASRIETPPRQTLRYRAGKLQTWIVIGHELPRVNPRDIPVLQVMNYILGGGHFDTRLFREVRDKRGLANDASGFLEFNVRGPGSYTFRTYGRHEVAQQLIDIIYAEIDRMQNELVSEEELFVAKGALIDGDFAMRFENGVTTARTLAEEFVRYGTLDHLIRYPDRVDDVSAEDVRRAAQRYLDPERMVEVIMGR